MGIRSFTLWTLLLTVASLVPRTALGRPIDLDRFPVCEASAAIEVPCVDDPKTRCIWVGDNEQENNSLRIRRRREREAHANAALRNQARQRRGRRHRSARPGRDKACSSSARTAARAIVRRTRSMTASPSRASSVIRCVPSSSLRARAGRITSQAATRRGSNSRTRSRGRSRVLCAAPSVRRLPPPKRPQTRSLATNRSARATS